MTDPNAPARYDDEANVEPTARGGEVVPEVSGEVPEEEAEETPNFFAGLSPATIERLKRAYIEGADRLLGDAIGGRLVTEKPISWRGIHCTIEWTTVKRLY